MDEEKYLTLEFDNGESVVCEIVGVFDLDDKQYIAVIPEGDEEEYWLYGYVEVSDDEYDIVEIEDNDEFNRAVKELESLIG